MDSERSATSPLLAAIRDLRSDIDRLIDEQKQLLIKVVVAREPDSNIVRAFSAEPAAPHPPSPPPPATPITPSRTLPSPPKPTRKAVTPEGGNDDIGKRLKDLSSRLERLRTTSTDAGDSQARPGGS